MPKFNVYCTVLDAKGDDREYLSEVSPIEATSWWNLFDFLKTKITPPIGVGVKLLSVRIETFLEPDMIEDTSPRLRPATEA